MDEYEKRVVDFHPWPSYFACFSTSLSMLGSVTTSSCILNSSSTGTLDMVGEVTLCMANVCTMGMALLV